MEGCGRRQKKINKTLPAKRNMFLKFLQVGPSGQPIDFHEPYTFWAYRPPPKQCLFMGMKTVRKIIKHFLQSQVHFFLFIIKDIETIWRAYKVLWVSRNYA